MWKLHITGKLSVLTVGVQELIILRMCIHVPAVMAKVSQYKSNKLRLVSSNSSNNTVKSAMVKEK